MSNPNGNGAKPPPKLAARAGDVVRRPGARVLHLVRPVPGPGGRDTTRLVETATDDMTVGWEFVTMPAGPVTLPMIELTITGADGAGVARLIPLSGVSHIEVPVRRLVVDELAASPVIVPGRA